LRALMHRAAMFSHSGAISTRILPTRRSNSLSLRSTVTLSIEGSGPSCRA
jgi:hypothetical protein